MIGRFNHVAIAVPDLEAAVKKYRETLGAKVSEPQDEPAHGVTVVFIELPNTKVGHTHTKEEQGGVRSPRRLHDEVFCSFHDRVLLLAQIILHPVQPVHAGLELVR